MHCLYLFNENQFGFIYSHSSNSLLGKQIIELSLKFKKCMNIEATSPVGLNLCIEKVFKEGF